MFSSIGKALRNNILLGLMLITPLVVTAYIVAGLFRFITNNAFVSLLTGWLPETMRDAGYEKTVLGMMAVILVLMSLFLIGFFTRSFLGKKLYHLADMFIERIPVINKIYMWVRQISESFFAQRRTIFKEVVLVQYPRPGLWLVAFVTAPVASQFWEKFESSEEESFVSLFIPTTPNPTSGLMIIAPRSDLVALEISIADAMKLVISAGAVYPGAGLVDVRPTIIDKLESWISRDSP